MSEKRCIAFRLYLAEHPEAKCADRFGRSWPALTVVCSECGQPDNCGDCNCKEVGTKAINKIVEMADQQALSRLTAL
jgi:hypothetical protein